ncbi:MAG: phosphotransferase [Acidobacteria bacterium]|nr:phosphotransferase [Acidobacteriota bacterium]
MPARDEFQRQHPEAFLLDASDAPGLAAYLRARGWLGADERLVSAAKAGEGNMNYTLRVRASARSFILKQARPWVEKYPQIAAPWERALIEGRFYEVVSTEPQLAAMMPKLLGLDAQSHIIALEDLGEAQDFTTLYQGAELNEAQLDELATYLTHLHRGFIGAAFKSDFANHAMRTLNHLHIFDLPLQADNGLDLDALTPGLYKAAQTLKQNERYVSVVRELGELYLSDGETLLHGDFFPGSWLKTARGVRVIDPKFCFYGPPEFDLGVMVAHLYLAGQKARLIERLLENYQPPLSLKLPLVWQFAGIEMMRRLIGVAQLPLNSGLERKAELLRLSNELVLNS